MTRTRTASRPIRLFAGDLDGAEDRARLVHRLVVLVGRLRVGDGAAASLDVELAVLADDGPDVDRGVEVAVPGEVADGAAVPPALDLLQLVDDLHRPHLRGAGEGAGWERRAQHVHRRDVLFEPAGDLADDVEDVRVGLDDHQLVDLDAAVLADAAEVVAAEVDQHHVLGPLLWVVDQAGGEAAVLLLAAPTRGGAGDRPGLDPAAVDLDQRLGRGAGDLEIAEL